VPSQKNLSRAVIYARYSSDNQREASIEDQIEVCRRYIERQGWTIGEVYADQALSGASRFRPAFQQMQVDAEGGRFDIILAESLDRLSRKLADVADLHDRLSFLRIGLHTVATGEITPMHVGMLGTMAQMYLKDLAEKTRRGQLGRALKGRIPGGRAYGYDVLPADADGAGERRINSGEAAVVQRIFALFAACTSPRAMVKQLNAEGVPGPDGRDWRDTTIRGQLDRGTGILNNALYAGRLEWNRCAYVKDPRTGKRVARPSPRKQWEIVPVPELRIVDDELWDAVKARQTEVRIVMSRDADGNALNGAHRQRYLLSGLLECGVCGGGFTIVNAHDYGCATARAKGTCSNQHRIRREELERRVLDGLKHRLLAPELVEEFARRFQEEVNRQMAERSQSRTHDEGQLEAVRRKIASMIRAIEDGLYQPSMKARMAELETDKAALEERLAEAPEPPTVRLHPNLAGVYREKVAALEQALANPLDKTEAMEIVRSQIERITLTPNAEGSLDIHLCGDLAHILQWCEAGPGKSERPGTGVPGRGLSVVAGAGFEPATFRL
jgi:DNA invertase Pin-like site-specific DNA recombinase